MAAETQLIKGHLKIKYKHNNEEKQARGIRSSGVIIIDAYLLDSFNLLLQAECFEHDRVPLILEHLHHACRGPNKIPKQNSKR